MAAIELVGDTSAEAPGQAVSLVGDTSQPVDLAGDTSQPIQLVGIDGGPSAVTAREQPSGDLGGNTFTKGVQRGTKQSIGLAGQLIKSIGDRTGFASMVDIGDELIQEAFVEAISNPAEVGGFEDIKSFGDAGTFVAQILGEQAFNIGLAATGAGLGGYLARASIGKAALRKLAEKSAAGKGSEFLAKDVVQRYFKSNKSGLVKGAAAGTFAAFLPINTGEILQESRDAGFDPDLSGSLVLGSASSALEVLGFGILGHAIFGAAKKEVVESVMTTVLHRIGHVSLRGLAGEGGTEAVQEALVIGSRKINDPTFSITDAINSSEGLKRIAFAGVSGAVVGGVLGGAGGVATSVPTIAQLGLQKANARLNITEAKESVEQTFAENESEEVQSLFDFGIARKQMSERVNTVKEAAGVALAAAKQRLSPADQNAAVAAATQRQAAVQEELDQEDTALDKAADVLGANRTRTDSAIDNLQKLVDTFVSPTEGQERSAGQQEATTKAAAQIRELLDSTKKLNREQRAAKVPEMLDLVDDLVSRGLNDPFSIPKKRVKALLKRAKDYADVGYVRKAASLNKSRRLNKVAKNTVRRASADFPDIVSDGSPQGTTTPVGETLRSIAAVAKGDKPAAFVVGVTVSTLPKAVKAAVGRGKLLVRQDGDRVIIANKENIDKDVEALSFATPSDQLDDNAAVVTTRDEAGGVIQNEAVPGDPLAVREAVRRGEQIGASTESRTPAEAITEAVSELVEESKETGIHVPINIVEDILEQESQLYVRMPNSNRLMYAFIDDEGVLRREDGKAFRLFDDEENVAKALKLKTSKERLEDLSPHTVAIDGKLVLRAVLPGGRTQAGERQVRKAIRRGDNTPNKAKYAVQGTKNGRTVWFHLGEVTQLGFLNDEGSTTLRDRLQNIRTHFLGGLSALMVDHGYEISFDPKQDGKKAVFGNLPYDNAGSLERKALATNNLIDRMWEEVQDQGGELADMLTLLRDQGIYTEQEMADIKAAAQNFDAGATNQATSPTGREGEAARSEERSSVMDEAVRNVVPNYAPGLKEGPQVQNSLTHRSGTVWTAATAATEFVLKTLNIKEKVILYDEDSAPGLLASYRIRGQLELQTAVMDTLLDQPTGRINVLPEGPVHIFVSKYRGSTSRGLILMHELGHLVQYTHLDRLSPELQAQVLDDLQGNTEAFANWMAVAAAKMSAGKPVQANSAVERLFKRIVEDLQRIWSHLRGKLQYPHSFAAFVEALNTHAAVQQNRRAPRNLSTPLAKTIFAELQQDAAGAYITAPATADMTIEADAAGRAEDSVFQSYVTDFQTFAGRLKDRPIKASMTLVRTADGELRSMGAFGTKLARLFHALPSSADPSNTVFRETQQEAAPHFTKLQQILKEVPGARISLAETFANMMGRPSAKHQADHALRAEITEALLLHTPLNELSTEVAAEVQKIRKYLNGLYRWFRKRGMQLRPRKDYYPMMLDLVSIDKNRAKFEALLQKHGFSPKSATDIRTKLSRDENGGLTNGFQEDGGTTTEFKFQGPGFASKKARTDRDTKWNDALRADLVEAGFYQQDIATTLIAYTEMIVRRAVWEGRFKDKTDFNQTDVFRAQKERYEKHSLNINHPIARLQLEVAEAHASGAINDWQYQRIVNDILPAYAGQLGLRTNSHIRKLSGGIVIYQNLRILSLAVLSSFVDVGTLMARGNWQDSSAALTILLDKQSRDNAFEMLEAIGGMRQGLTEHVLNDQALNTFMTGNAKRINDLFFRYNGMEGWTNLMRAMGLVSAREFMQRNARKAEKGDATAQRYLNELDITSGEVLAWDGHSTESSRINFALNRYIDESMIRPDASIRPVWMSDPGYAIFAHLKGFLYGFHETFLRRVGREARIHQNLLPLVMLGTLALPFAVIGYEIRRKITGATYAPQGFDYFKEVVERSGLPGAFQLIVDMEQADEFGKPYALGIAGPAVEQLYDFFDKDFEGWLPRAIPVVAQSPVLRGWVEDQLE